MIYVLFILLACLFAVEASTALCRKVGYNNDCPDAGLILQGSLAIVSRALVFLFMPIVGWLSDSGNVFNEPDELVYSFLIIPLILCAVYLKRSFFEFIFKILILRIIENGSYFKPTANRIEKAAKKSYTSRKALSLPRRIVFLAYLPYYLCWPMIFVLLDFFPENRGLILGLSSVLNGINTVIITFFVDPFLIRLGKYKRLISLLYDQLVLSRIAAAGFSTVVLIIIVRMI